METLVGVESFVDGPVRAYLAQPGNEERYPGELVQEMAAMGLFGLNVPRRFGGLEAEPEHLLTVTEELARGWLCLPSIVGSHMRIAAYFLACGRPEQQQDYLPRLARGHEIWAHAYNERQCPSSAALTTRLLKNERGWRLNGAKHWVTHAREAFRILVIARTTGSQLAAVMVDPRRGEVHLEDLDRPGLRAVSLCRVELNDYAVDPETDLIGGLDANVSEVLAQARRPKALAFASRAVGAGRALVDEVRRLMAERGPAHPLAQYRWGRILVEQQASQALFKSARAGESQADAAKVFCSEALLRMLDEAMRLTGGDGFAHPNNALARLQRDAVSLSLAGTPNDVLVGRLGAASDRPRANGVAARPVPASERTSYVPVIERYGGALLDIPESYLQRSSLREEARILGPVDVDGRELYFLDLSTGTASGTFKDWLACVTVADCLRLGVSQMVTQTSANTGNALGLYASRLGIRLTVFYPARNRYKINPDIANSENCRFVEVDKSEPELKELTWRYARVNRLEAFPTFEHQIEANKLRAYFVRDWCAQNGVRFDWHAQTLSSAYGVFGFYHGLSELGEPFPAFLGVQQASLAPFYHHLQGTPPQLDPAGMLEPTMFRTSPGSKLLDRMAEICGSSGGTVVAVSTEAYHRLLPAATAFLEEGGLGMQPSRVIADFSEKSPLLGLMGVLQAIETGRIRAGQKVLLAVTGGVGRVAPREFEPRFFINRRAGQTDEEMAELAQQLWGRRRT